MTLNDLEQHNSPYFAFFHWIRYFAGDYVTVVEIRAGNGSLTVTHDPLTHSNSDP